MKSVLSQFLENESHKLNYKNTVVVLLGGLTSKSGSYMFKIKTKLEENGFYVLDNIPCESIKLSIEQQACEFKRILKTKVRKEENLILIGHSQGGLRSYEIFFSKDFKIKGLITIATPWNGATILRNRKVILYYLKKLESYIPNNFFFNLLIDYLISFFIIKKYRIIIFFTLTLIRFLLKGIVAFNLKRYNISSVIKNLITSKGCSDMNPDSQLIEKIKHTLIDSNNEIEIHNIIASGQDIFSLKIFKIFSIKNLHDLLYLLGVIPNLLSILKGIVKLNKKDFLRKDNDLILNINDQDISLNLDIYGVEKLNIKSYIIDGIHDTDISLEKFISLQENLIYEKDETINLLVNICNDLMH